MLIARCKCTDENYRQALSQGSIGLFESVHKLFLRARSQTNPRKTVLARLCCVTRRQQQAFDRDSTTASQRKAHTLVIYMSCGDDNSYCNDNLTETNESMCSGFMPLKRSYMVSTCDALTTDHYQKGWCTLTSLFTKPRLPVYGGFVLGRFPIPALAVLSRGLSCDLYHLSIILAFSYSSLVLLIAFVWSRDQTTSEHIKSPAQDARRQ